MRFTFTRVSDTRSLFSCKYFYVYVLDETIYFLPHKDDRFVFFFMVSGCKY